MCAHLLLRRVALLIPVAALAAASTVRAESIVRTEPVIVAESPLSADADGTSQVRLPDVAPLSFRGLSNLADHVANFHVNSSGAGSFGGVIALRGLSNTP